MRSNTDLPISNPPTLWVPADIAPRGLCNSDLPRDSVLTRFLWTVNYFVSQGLYVNIDFHSYGLEPIGQSAAALGASGADFLPYTPVEFFSAWTNLVSLILDNIPAARGKLLLDLLNEPDGYATPSKNHAYKVGHSCPLRDVDKL